MNMTPTPCQNCGTRLNGRLDSIIHYLILGCYDGDLELKKLGEQK